MAEIRPKVSLPAWISQGEPEAAALIQKWLCPRIYNATDQRWETSTAQLSWIPKCEALVRTEGFREYWRDVQSAVKPPGRLAGAAERGLLMQSLLIQMLYRGGQVPSESPSQRRKRRRRLLDRAIKRANAQDYGTAKRILMTDGTLSHQTFLRKDVGDEQLAEVIGAVDARLANGEELNPLERGPASPIGVQGGRRHAQALLLERALRALFIHWTGQPNDRLIARGRALALGSDDPFRYSSTSPGDRFRNSRK